MLCRRLVAHVTKAILSSPHKCFRFSSSLTLNPLSNSFDDGIEVGSVVYRHTLKFQGPGFIEWCKQLENTASFIGSVTRQPRVVNVNTNEFGVCTSLNVRTSEHSSFRVHLKMWDVMAEFAFKHLKPNDFIFVSGILGSYTKDDGNGNLRFFYEVTVKELNFVAQGPCHHRHKSTEEIGMGIDPDENRLHLWQVFFASPHEWRDYRNRKVNPKQPDFRHKDTGEALWLSKNDPPWIKKQLQILDSKIAEGEPVGRRSRVSTWVYHD